MLVRQLASLKAAVALNEVNLGHTALPMVRPACDELIWVTYLCSLQDGHRSLLLHAIHAVESARTVNAQQQHLGSKTMRAVGFPKGFVTALAKFRIGWEERLAIIGESLGPDGLEHLPPGASWLANQVGMSDLHAFLYSASSKGVHFSVTEHMRSGYFEPGPEATVELAAPAYVAYRSGFALYWLCELLVRTIAAVANTLPGYSAEPSPAARKTTTSCRS